MKIYELIPVISYLNKAIDDGKQISLAEIQNAINNDDLFELFTKNDIIFHFGVDEYHQNEILKLLQDYKGEDIRNIKKFHLIENNGLAYF